jgi:hypothetical protein
MTKQKILKVVNPLLAILVVNQAMSGMLHDVLSHQVFEVLHKGGWIMVVLAALHLYLNWGWVKLNYLKRRSSKSVG